MDFLDLLQEEIFLVEKKHNGSCGEEPVIADAVEEMEALVHSVLRRGRDENNLLTLTCTARLSQVWSLLDVSMASEFSHFCAL